MIIRHETAEKFDAIEERIGKMIHDGLKDTIETVKANEVACDEFDVIIKDHAKRLEKHNTQITKLEEQIPNLEKQLKMCIVISQGILCKPKKDKHKDPRYPEFSAAIKDKEQDS